MVGLAINIVSFFIIATAVFLGACFFIWILGLIVSASDTQNSSKYEDKTDKFVKKMSDKSSDKTIIIVLFAPLVIGFLILVFMLATGSAKW